jgi:hypothetical protein
MDEGMTTGRSDVLRELALPACVACASVISLIDKRAADGQRQKSSTFTLGSTRLAPESTAETPVVDVLVDDKGGVLVDGAGTVVHKSPPAKLNFRHSLTWQAGWLVSKSVLVK